MGLDGTHVRAQQELVEEHTNPLSITEQQFWLTREVPDKWKLENGLSVYRKGQREERRNYRSVSLTWMLGKITELIILERCTLLDKIWLDDQTPRLVVNGATTQLASGH
ncbi:hypothetical protein DUI87_25019 [Hirundo rustica rustica]|uniref:Uncharacterized protein n=1 Tax=Hirundo rustica rustica TaxID=333673 RepID=A0A3M0JEN8_HIRRU|nr:hypothetical protein DUI87_25019 [Hirundo rustica rustica]